jgi:hypothetical protein
VAAVTQCTDDRISVLDSDNSIVYCMKEPARKAVVFKGDGGGKAQGASKHVLPSTTHWCDSMDDMVSKYSIAKRKLVR